MGMLITVQGRLCHCWIVLIRKLSFIFWIKIYLILIPLWVWLLSWLFSLLATPVIILHLPYSKLGKARVSQRHLKSLSFFHDNPTHPLQSKRKGRFCDSVGSLSLVLLFRISAIAPASLTPNTTLKNKSCFGDLNFNVPGPSELRTPVPCFCETGTVATIDYCASLGVFGHNM